MVQDKEENFPRGGKAVIISVKRKPKNDTLFGNEPKKQKKAKVEKKVSVDDSQISLANIGMLTRQTITEGMKLLACIKKITEHALEVELPGLIIGKVMIDSISDSLVKTLKKALSDSSNITSVSDILKSFFHCGQYVPLKIKSIQISDDKSVILGSISPRDLNSDRRHNSFRKGELVWASVVSEQDHGYQLDSGVANCRIFLPTQHLDVGQKLDIGQPVWCKVLRVDSDNAASTLRVGIKRQHIDSTLTDDTIPLNFILPGTKVEVYVEKVLKNGISCKFLENFSGFIHESQLSPVLRSLNTIKESSVMCAYVLYVENILKITQLSMRGLDSTYELAFERGNKVSAEVIGRNELGVYFKLNKQEKGWISNKRLLSNCAENSDSLSYINEKYTKGSKHQCVVLSYNKMDCVYICGIEKELLKEKYFSFKDLNVGDLVEGTVQEIKKNGVVLGVGKVRGFVPNIHLTDVSYSEFIKRKFVVGKKVKARVFSSSEKTVIFTLKTSFVKDDKYFKDLDSVQVNEVYPALVLRAKIHGVVLSFYNNLEGYLPFKEYNFQITQEYRENPSSFFYSGQVIKVRVVKVKTDKVIASLKLDAIKSIASEVGKTVKSIVEKKEENGLTVFINKLNIEGFVPVEHLSIDLSLCRPMLESDVEGTDGDDQADIDNGKGSGEELRQFKDQDQINCPLAVLPPISNFFNAEIPNRKEDSSSEDEEHNAKKTKKTSAAEKKKADPTQEVESTERYEQLLMNNPNSSTLWLKYIAFCLATLDFEKARSIGRRALASISMTCEDDKFNIWMTLLNIENLYGSRESFESVFEEAVKYNDAFKVYMRVTALLFESGKLVELKEKMNIMKAKFKKEADMWVQVAKICYLIGNLTEARNLKNLSLKSILVKKEQYNLVLKFAILEFSHGEIDTGIQIFDSVLITYPNKIGAWLVYIDQLVSKNQLKEAREVLNRAIKQSFPLKSLKSLYHKYREFELKYGTPETLAAFKEKAKHILQEKIQVVSS